MFAILATVSKEPPPVDDIAGLLGFFFTVIVLLGIAALIKSIVQGPAANPPPPDFQQVHPDPGALVLPPTNSPAISARSVDVELEIDEVEIAAPATAFRLNGGTDSVGYRERNYG